MKNILEILTKYASIGDVFYTPLIGEIELKKLVPGPSYAHIEVVYKCDTGIGECCFDEYGKWFSAMPNSECLLFPSKEQRDWDVYVKEKETEKDSIHAGDYILINDRQYKVISDSDKEIFRVRRLRSAEMVIDDEYIGKNDKITKESKFRPSELKPFDRVIARNEKDDLWTASFFSHMCGNLYGLVHPFEEVQKYCIPYNQDTSHLVGTKQDEPDFYKID